MIRRTARYRIVLLVSAVVVLSAAECDVQDIIDPAPAPAPPGNDPTPTTLVRARGDGQIGTVGQPLSNPLVVRVDDQSGNPMSGIAVSFRVMQGGGTVGPATANTGSDGEASTTWTVGTTVGAQQATASVSGIANSVTFSATATAGAPANVSANAGDGQQALTGTAVPVSPSVLVQDAFGNAVAGVQVTFAVLAGGGDLTNPVVNTGATGVATVGSWTLGTGANTLSATVTGAGISGNPVTFSATGLTTLFDIELRYVGSVTPSGVQQQAFTDAATKWQSILVEDLPNQLVSFADTGRCGGAARPAMQETIEDLVIFVEFVDIDGPFGVLGQAGPCVVRGTSRLPALGGMLFDSADVQRLENNSELSIVVLHEMGHVLGFGTLWKDRNLLQDPSDTTAGGTLGAETYFSGVQAINAFVSLGGVLVGSGPGVPVENDHTTYGPGSLDGHWRESVFGNELMSPSLNSGVLNPLGVVTAASMGDMGYGVNISAADSYVLPGPQPVSGHGSRIVFAGDIWNGPVAVVDDAGRTVSMIRRYEGPAPRR